MGSVHSDPEFQKDEALATNTGFIPPLLSNALSSLLPSHCGLHALLQLTVSSHIAKCYLVFWPREFPEAGLEVHASRA